MRLKLTEEGVDTQVLASRRLLDDRGPHPGCATIGEGRKPTHCAADRGGRVGHLHLDVPGHAHQPVQVHKQVRVWIPTVPVVLPTAVVVAVRELHSRVGRRDRNVLQLRAPRTADHEVGEKLGGLYGYGVQSLRVLHHRVGCDHVDFVVALCES